MVVLGDVSECHRRIFNFDSFNPCWEWKRGDLGGIAGIEIRAGRSPYFFQLAHDEPARKFKPAQSAHGELVSSPDAMDPRWRVCRCRRRRAAMVS